MVFPFPQTPRAHQRLGPRGRFYQLAGFPPADFHPVRPDAFRKLALRPAFSDTEQDLPDIADHELDEDGLLDGGQVLPGFQLSLRSLFERADRQGPTLQE